MTSLIAFLDHNIDSYLFGDLSAMRPVVEKTGVKGGGLGYPTLMSTYAGIEFLGALLSKKPFDTFGGRTYFESY
jgi:hypothetical protein